MSQKLLELKKQLKKKQRKLKHYDKALDARNHVKRTLSRKDMENCPSSDKKISKEIKDEILINIDSNSKTVTFREGSPDILFVSPRENANIPSNDISQSLGAASILEYQNIDGQKNSPSKLYEMELPEKMSDLQHDFPATTSKKLVNESQFIEDIFSEPLNYSEVLKENFGIDSLKKNLPSQSDCVEFPCDYFIDEHLQARDILASTINNSDNSLSLFTVNEDAFSLWPLDLNKNRLTIKHNYLKVIPFTMSNEAIKKRTSSRPIIQAHCLAMVEDLFLIFFSASSNDERLMMVLARFTSASNQLSFNTIPQILLCPYCQFLSCSSGKWNAAIYIKRCHNRSCVNYFSDYGELFVINYDLVFSKKDERWKIETDVHKIDDFPNAELFGMSSFLLENDLKQKGCLNVVMDGKNNLSLFDMANREEILRFNSYIDNNNMTPILIWSAALKNSLMLLFKIDGHIIATLVNPLEKKQQIICRWKLPEGIYIEWSDSNCSARFHSGHFVVCAKEAILRLPCL